MLTKIHPNLLSAIEASIIARNNFNYCRRIDTGSHFCKSYYAMVVEKKITKFGFANYINVLPYQKYFNVLNNLTAIKKAIITCINLIILVINLRSNSFGLFVLYHQIWDHIVILLQNPRLLLIRLSLSILVSHNVVCIVWASKQPYTPSDISLFAHIWRIKVLKILYWLRTNNFLYKNIVINLDLLNT